MHPRVYILCTTDKIGRLSIEVDGHVNPNHKALRYVLWPMDLAGIPRESIYVDLLNVGPRSQHHSELQAIARALQMRPIELWKLKAVIRQIEGETA